MYEHLYWNKTGKGDICEEYHYWYSLCVDMNMMKVWRLLVHIYWLLMRYTYYILLLENGAQTDCLFHYKFHCWDFTEAEGQAHGPGEQAG